MRLLDGRRLDAHGLELVEAPLVRGLLLAEEPAQDGDAFLEPRHPLGRANAHHPVLEGLGGALFVGAAEADHQPGAATGEDVEARPLLGEEHWVPVHERGEASYPEPHPGGHRGEGGQERDRLEPRLGEEAIAHPDGVERPRGLGLHRQLEQLAAPDGAQHDGAIGQRQSEGCLGHW
jgi:hypothetical protein